MAITMEDIKKLRAMTGAGLADVKKALTEADGDFEKAQEIIRQKGQAIAAKRSDRETANGCVQVKSENGFSAIIALKCETDFVAKNADFVGLATEIMNAIVANKCKSMEEVKELSRKVTCVTHNHPEGIKGAQAVALCVFMARNGSTKEEIRTKVTSMFGYDLNFTIDGIRPTYGWNSDFGNGVLCQASVPQAIVAFLDGNDFEDCIRNAISIGGDSDTIACITGSIAEAFYGVPENIRQEVMKYLPEIFRIVIADFEARFQGRQ